MLSRIMAVQLIFLLTSCGGSTMLGYEEPNVGEDEIPSSNERTQAAEARNSVWDLQAEQAARDNYESFPDIPEDTAGSLSLKDARATVQAQLNDDNYVESDPNGCPYGCDYHKQGCDIKGNISFDTKEKIYHVPGGEWYDKANISPAYGERWFCSEQEAINNGWRKSQK
jgi:hypothetical protein